MTTTAPTEGRLDKILTEQRRVTAQLQQHLESVRQRCMCGRTFPTVVALNDHRAHCRLLRVAIIGDIVRVAVDLGRTPTRPDYDLRRLSELPSVSTFTTRLEVFRTWNEAVAAAGLVVNRETTQEGEHVR